MPPRSSLAPLLALALAACGGRAASPAPATPASAPPPASFAFTTTLDRDAPLVGKVWDTARGAFTTEAAVAEAAAKATFVLLGEKHDNPDHHALQARVLAAMVAAGRRPAVAWEMIEANRQGALDGFLAGAPTSAALGKAVGWETSGWPAWPEYEPIARVALDAKLALVAANLPHAAARAVVHEGAAGLDPATAARIGLDRPLPAAEQAAIEQEMIDSHCGMLPPRKAAPMALAQRARDATMADRMLGADGGGGAVLIAGSGHAHRERGVPFYLRARRKDATIVTIAFAEVAKDAPDPRSYADRWGGKALPFDYVWFTPRANDDDPCAAFRQAHEPRASAE